MTNAQPGLRRTGSVSAWASRCSILIVTSYEISGNSAWNARDGNGVADAVEEVRVAERDVSGARGNAALGRLP